MIRPNSEGDRRSQADLLCHTQFKRALGCSQLRAPKYPGCRRRTQSAPQFCGRWIGCSTATTFCNSKRYPALLEYIIRETLAGNADSLKERVLGMAVFHRPPDYDANADPVVRVTAGEIRKRIAQFYHEEGAGEEIYIDLRPGSYVPEFYPVAPKAAQTKEPVDLFPGERPAPSIRGNPRYPWKRRERLPAQQGESGHGESLRWP